MGNGTVKRPQVGVSYDGARRDGNIELMPPRPPDGVIKSPPPSPLPAARKRSLPRRGTALPAPPVPPEAAGDCNTLGAEPC